MVKSLLHPLHLNFFLSHPLVNGKKTFTSYFTNEESNPGRSFHFSNLLKKGTSFTFQRVILNQIFIGPNCKRSYWVEDPNRLIITLIERYEDGYLKRDS